MSVVNPERSKPRIGLEELAGNPSAARSRMFGLVETLKDLEVIARNGRHLGPIHKVVANEVRTMQQGHFDKEVDSRGQKWRALSPLTNSLRRKGKRKRTETGRSLINGVAHVSYTRETTAAFIKRMAGSRGILKDTGGLRASIGVLIANNEGWAVGTNKIYAAVHQYGATIKPKKGKYLYIPVGKSGSRSRSQDSASRRIALKQAVIPKREYLYLNMVEMQTLVDLYVDGIHRSGTAYINWLGVSKFYESGGNW